MNDPLLVGLGLLLVALAGISFGAGCLFGITHEAKAQAKRRAAEAEERRRQRSWPHSFSNNVFLPFLLVLSFCLDAGAAPRPKPRPDPELVALRQELLHLPGRAVCRAYIEQADQHMEYLRSQAFLWPSRLQDICEYDQQVSYWRDVWDCLDDAQNEAFCVSYRQERLGRVREAIGEQAYYLGFIPAPVAAHWFSVVGD